MGVNVRRLPNVDMCPQCGKTLDPAQHRYRESFLRKLDNGTLGQPRWPTQYLAEAYTVRCPHCGSAYVSESLKLLGFLTISRYRAISVLFILSAAIIGFGTAFGLIRL